MPETPDAELQQEFFALETENRRAFLERDVAALAALWSDALLVNSPHNRVNDKAQVLELLGRGIIAHSLYEADVERVERFGEVVAVMGGERVVNAPGSPVIRRRFTNLWRREGGAWRMFLRHANVESPVPPMSSMPSPSPATAAAG